jgi:hypothetical protein
MQSTSTIYIDPEVEIKILNKTIYPDYLIMRSNTNEFSDGIIDTPLYVIEAKRFEGGQAKLESQIH